MYVLSNQYMREGRARGLKRAERKSNQCVVCFLSLALQESQISQIGSQSLSSPWVNNVLWGGQRTGLSVLVTHSHVRCTTVAVIYEKASLSHTHHTHLISRKPITDRVALSHYSSLSSLLSSPLSLSLSLWFTINVEMRNRNAEINQRFLSLGQC